MARRFSKGAEWRVWDLQVHTPYSVLNNNYGDDIEAYAKVFFNRAIEKGVAVVGVTDYFSVQGYRYLKALQQDDARLVSLLGENNAPLAKDIVLFANVELRLDVLVNSNRVNYHVLFSDEVSADDIEQDFLGQLNFTWEGSPQGADQQLSLTLKNLADIGRLIKQDHEKFAKDSDLFVGMKMAAVGHQQVTDILRARSPKFGKKHVLCVPCDEDLSSISWDSQGHLVRKVLIQKAHVLFSSNQGTRAFALGLKHSSPEKYLKEFHAFKPCVHGSDAHSASEMFEPHDSRLTWIKADPTFRGLLQTINEPDARVFIGATPPGLEAVRNRPTKIVKELVVHKKPGSNLSEKWFDCRIELNPELVAIIGNKGSGKSALADILGLIGNTPRYEDFSFLSATRFKDRKSNKAKHFEASALWGDNKHDGPMSLDDVPEVGAVETIKYIPQDYLESICNEVGLGQGSQFYAELQNVIFSHVPSEQRMGFQTLDDLLDHRSEETKRTIDFLVDELKEINREIVACEEQLTDQYRKALEAKLVAKQREIEAHDATKPAQKAAPSEDAVATELTEKVNSQLHKLQEDLSMAESDISAAKQKMAAVIRRKVTAERLLGKLSNLEKQVLAAANDAKSEAQELDVLWSDLVSFSIDKSPVEKFMLNAEAQEKSLLSELDPQRTDGAVGRQAHIQKVIAELSQQLSAPQRAYEEYRLALKQWQTSRDELLGTSENLGSLNYIKAEIQRIPTTQERFGLLVRSRLAKAKEIFREKEALRDDYGRYYGAVQDFLAGHVIAKNQQFKLTFNVAIAQQGFKEGFLKLLNQRRVGSFSGLDEGAERLKQMLDRTDFSSVEELTKFLVQLMKALREDQRPDRVGARVELQDQLSQGVKSDELYDYVFGLSYLEPIYNLRWDGKTLEQLSPGERGNLLLIFYLLIDRDNIPLVIDQPEENLDNHTVFRTLVPCVKEAKTRRQIIMVTHNPNLAVVCDAEQVICAEILKNQANEVRYVCGSIEDELINKKIVDILEGTRPAFDKRDSKYFSN